MCTSDTCGSLAVLAGLGAVPFILCALNRYFNYPCRTSAACSRRPRMHQSQSSPRPSVTTSTFHQGVKTIDCQRKLFSAVLSCSVLSQIHSSMFVSNALLCSVGVSHHPASHQGGQETPSQSIPPQIIGSCMLVHGLCVWEE